MTDTSPEALDKLWHDLDSIGVIDDMEPQREDDIIELAMRTINAIAAEKHAAQEARFNFSDAFNNEMIERYGRAYKAALCGEMVLLRRVLTEAEAHEVALTYTLQSAALALQGKDAQRLREAIERDAADAAYKAGLGVSEWRSFVPKYTFSAIEFSREA